MGDSFTVKIFHKSLYIKESVQGLWPPPYTVGRMVRETHLVDKLVHASIAGHCNSVIDQVVCVLLCKSIYLKVLEVQEL
jgi:hypothetical protein